MTILEELTPREKDVLKEMIKAQTSNEIGEILGISPRTVDSHISKILSKLGARYKSQVIYRYFQGEYKEILGEESCQMNTTIEA